MIKLSFITDEATQDFEEAVALAKKFNLDGLELRTIENQPVEDIAIKIQQEWKKRLDEDGLVVSNMAGSFFKCEITGDLEKELEKLKRLCDTADIFCCETIRGFCFLTSREGRLSPKQLVPYYKEAAQILNKRGKKLLLEADPSVNTSNHQLLKELLDELNSAWPSTFGAIYDPGNNLFDPLKEKPFPDGYEAIYTYINHIHVKDAVYDEKGEPVCVAPGQGMVGYQNLLTRLKTDGYEGWLSLEPHYRKNTELTREQMLHPGGEAFSNGGIAALEESILSLQNLLEEA